VETTAEQCDDLDRRGRPISGLFGTGFHLVGLADVNPSYQAVPGLVNGLDESWRPGAVVERAPKLDDGCRHGIIADERPTPDRVEQLGSRDDNARHRSEKNEYLHRFRLDAAGDPTLGDLVRCNIDLPAIDDQIWMAHP
jgi:hypothetical protein